MPSPPEPTRLAVALGAVVRRRRKALRLPQDQIVSVSRVWVQEIEAGRANVTLATLSTLADELGTTGSQLLAEAEAEAGIAPPGGSTMSPPTAR